MLGIIPNVVAAEEEVHDAGALWQCAGDDSCTPAAETTAAQANASTAYNGAELQSHLTEAFW